VTRIKMCGFTDPGDACAAAAAGVDAIGLVFWPKSPRAVTVEQAVRIASALPPLVGVVGVFVDEPPDSVESIARAVGLTAVQLHGDEAPETWASAGRPVIKSVAVGEGFDPAALGAWPARVTPLLDAHDRARRGGTGCRVDVALAAAAARVRPVVLAGGLTPANVADAIRAIRPAAVDVSSGIERLPGRKDPALMDAFVRAVRGACVGVAR
jgi:phosphoribosylanthranilate isomerase